MSHLYVCHFSNGHIKVGRSIDPASRIAQHEERVSCMGVELIAHHIESCEGGSEYGEQMLIGLCDGYPGATRFKNEWFSGLSYETVCEWARQCASMESPRNTGDTFGTRLVALRKQHGLTQTELGRDLGGSDVHKAAISSWEQDRHEPSLSILRALCVRLNCTPNDLLGFKQPAQSL